MIRKVLVCGGRDYGTKVVDDKSVVDDDQVQLLFNTLDTLPQPLCIIHGAARGADALAAKWAQSRNQPQMSFPAKWHEYGRAAGIYRNIQMLEEGEPDLVVAFPGGRGTAHMTKIARAAGVKVWHINT